MTSEENQFVNGIIIEEEDRIRLRDLCRYCDVNAEIILEMVEEGVVQPQGTDPREWVFHGRDIKRIQIAIRLQRDLRVNLPGAALALDLIEQLEEMRRLLRKI